ncbi:MAG: tetracycline efflux MFS transporter TetA(P) [Anaerolineae bacterium]
MIRQPLLKKLDAYLVYLIFAGSSSIAFTLVFAVNLVYHVERVGLSPFQLVLVGTVLEVTVFLFEIPTGVIADVYSRRLSVILGSTLCGIGFVIEGLFPSFGAVLTAQIVWGIGATFHSGAVDAWVADEIGTERAGRAYLRAAQLGSALTIVAQVLGILLGSVSLQLAIIVGGLLNIGIGLFLLAFMPEDGYTPTPRTERTTFNTLLNGFTAGRRVIQGRPLLVTILLLAFVLGAATESYDRLSTFHLLESFTLPDVFQPVVWIGLISLTGSLIGVPFMEFAARRLNMDSHTAVTRTLSLMNLLMILGVLAFAFAPNFGVAAVVVVFIGITRGLNMPLRSAWVNQNVEPHVRATVMSITNQSDALGQIAGGPAIGYLGNVAGVRAALAAGALLMTPGIWLYQRARGQGAPVAGEVQDIA